MKINIKVKYSMLNYGLVNMAFLSSNKMKHLLLDSYGDCRSKKILLCHPE